MTARRTPAESFRRNRPARRGLAVAVALALGSPGCLKIPAEETEAPAAAKAQGEDAAIWPGKPAGALYRVGEVRSFEIRRDGALVGASHGRYEGPVADAPGQHRFATRIEFFPPKEQARAGGEPIRSAGEIIVDDAGDLIRGFERSAAAELRFERQGDAVVFTSGREREEIGYDHGTAFMAFWTILHEELLYGLRELAVGDRRWRQISLSGSLPTEVTASVERGDAPESATIVTNLGESITWRSGRIERIEIDAEQVEVTAVAPRWPGWSIAPPKVLAYAPPVDARFVARELELSGRAGQPRLFGEVLIPKGAKRPRPAVLFLSSTGQQDRHGIAGPPPVDLRSHDITDALASAGFVVLRFDERGQGESEAGELSYVEQLEDARRALRMLLVQEEVDPDRVAVVGHGEGGWRALTLAGEGRNIAAVALLASPGRPYEQVLRQQAAAVIDKLPPELRAAAKKEHERVIQALREDQAVPPELALQARWIRELMAVDPKRLFAGVSCPLWVAQGSKDFEVDPTADTAALLRLARRGRVKVTLARYPELDHLFVHEDGESSPERYLADGRQVDAEFLADLETWLSGKLGDPG
ncbi:MAG: alpha/beta fold hydrolase [Myxococcales bacterium]|nr:alpha/beta fold hydrolase [Myxococcales bacterium]